jgi:hypothetical protein
MIQILIYGFDEGRVSYEDEIFDNYYSNNNRGYYEAYNFMCRQIEKDPTFQCKGEIVYYRYFVDIILEDNLTNTDIDHIKKCEGLDDDADGYWDYDNAYSIGTETIDNNRKWLNGIFLVNESTLKLSDGQMADLEIEELLVSNS